MAKSTRPRWFASSELLWLVEWTVQVYLMASTVDRLANPSSDPADKLQLRVPGCHRHLPEPGIAGLSGRLPAMCAQCRPRELSGARPVAVASGCPESWQLRCTGLDAAAESAVLLCGAFTVTVVGL